MATVANGVYAGDNAFFGCAYCHEAFPEKRELEVHEKMQHPGCKFSSVTAPIPDREKGLLRKAPTAAISNRIPLSEVQRHCVPEDCWVAIEGKVYDLTEFMDRHPGGPTSILSWAGKDATKMFLDIHKGVKIDQYLRPEAYLGQLGVDEELMSDEFWHTLRKARIVEVHEELERLGASTDAHPSRGALGRTVSEVLQHKDANEELRSKLQSLETQKRVALDEEDFAKAQKIKEQQDGLLSAAHGGVPQRMETAAGGIPLSEVARHNKPHDCWVAVKGEVYDLTDFLQHHPEQRNAVLAWAGRDASAMWDKIPGRFPSSTWMSFYMRPEACMGEVGPEPPVDPHADLIRQLKKELRRLQGPSQEDIQAAKSGASGSRSAAAAEASKAAEEDRFPKLRQARGDKELPFFTRAEVAKHKGPPGGPAGTEPYMILHNKVYDLTPLLGSHPGGDESLLSRAGTDATKDFELFEHSEKARVRREQDMLVGELVPGEHSDWGAEAAAEGGAAVAGGRGESPWAGYLKHKAVDGAMLALLWYVRLALQGRPLPKPLRFLNLLIAAGIFGAVASRGAGLRKALTNM